MAPVDGYSNPMLRWIVRIAVETGMRSSEITGLKLAQVDLAKRVVRLIETKNTMPRTVPLPVVDEAVSRLVDGSRMLSMTPSTHD